MVEWPAGTHGLRQRHRTPAPGLIKTRTASTCSIFHYDALFRTNLAIPPKHTRRPFLSTPSKMTCVEDFRQLAERRVPRMFYDYADSGSWTESTYLSNETDFQQLKFRQRVAVDITTRHLRSSMIGIDVAMPVAIAPTGLTGMQHADGEILGAKAAKQFGIPFTLSTMSICSIEDIAEHTQHPFWFQLYVMRDRDFMERLIDRAKAANCSALVLTLDLQVL